MSDQEDDGSGCFAAFWLLVLVGGIISVVGLQNLLAILFLIAGAFAIAAVFGGVSCGLCLLLKHQVREFNLASVFVLVPLWFLSLFVLMVVADAFIWYGTSSGEQVEKFERSVARAEEKSWHGEGFLKWRYKSEDPSLCVLPLKFLMGVALLFLFSVKFVAAGMLAVALKDVLNVLALPVSIGLFYLAYAGREWLPCLEQIPTYRGDTFWVVLFHLVWWFVVASVFNEEFRERRVC